jgi:NAD(P)-dependent dehydrogenase (short-subunit alcohol dehydrogenase family)
VTDYDFTDQVALVTGGGRGLGQAFAESLARAGATVIIVARSESQLQDTTQAIKQAGGRALAFAADVADRQAIERVVAEVEQQLGYIDLLLNNAGVCRALGPIAEIDPDDWWRESRSTCAGHICAPDRSCRYVGTRARQNNQSGQCRRSTGITGRRRLLPEQGCGDSFQ